MKKLLLLGMLSIFVTACNRNLCKTEQCSQCADACTVACRQEAHNADERICKNTCQCTCVEIEKGASLEEALDTCL